MPKPEPPKKGYTLDELKGDQPSHSYTKQCRYCRKPVHVHNSLAICADCYVLHIGTTLNGYDQEGQYENN